MSDTGAKALTPTKRGHACLVLLPPRPRTWVAVFILGGSMILASGTLVTILVILAIICAIVFIVRR